MSCTPSIGRNDDLLKLLLKSLKTPRNASCVVYARRRRTTSDHRLERVVLLGSCLCCSRTGSDIS